LSAPNIDPFKIELPKEGPLVYEFEVEVRPQFDLPSYKNLKIRRPVHTYSDEEVAAEKRRILAPHGQIVPKESGSVEVGDIITTDITSRYGDRLLNELKELTVRVEPRLAFKDGVAEKFGEQLAGAKAGDKRVVDLTLSTSVSDATLQGKTVKATFDIKDVKTLRLPELTHDFLHEFGVHTEDQLDELVRVVLQRRLEYRQRQSAREQVLSQISAASSWELPHDLLIRQARKSLARRIMEMRSEGISEEEIRGRQRILEQDILQNTALALKEHFVLQKIAEVEKIDVDEDDLNDEIERIADQYQESPRRVRARLEKEDMMEALAAELIERKALDLILDSAEYEDVPLDPKKDSAVGTIEEQGVPGEMQDLTTPPAEEQPAPEQS
jgi:trigger factor